MILGIGSDIVDIRRIERTLERFGERFLHRVFTEEERRRSERRQKRVESYAKRFAAKEACAKALGTGMRQGVAWRSIGVVNAPSGKPQIALEDKAEKRLQKITPQGMRPSLQLTITDEYPLAHAVVIISAQDARDLYEANNP